MVIDRSNITYLVTTIHKSLEQIILMVKNNNLKGKVIVGCQKSEKEYVDTYNDGSLSLQVYFQTTTGTSVNRNYLLKKVDTEYCFFFDDDIKLLDGDIDIINRAIEKLEKFDLVFFDYKYEDSSRKKVKWTLKRKLHWIKMRSYGTNSVLYNVSFILNNNFSFNENIGPGRYISSGEDGQFLIQATKKSNYAFSHKEEIIQISYEEGSTWFTGYEERFFVNIGFSYGMTYGIFAVPLIIYTIIKHRKEYLANSSFFNAYKSALKGLKLYGKSK